MAARKKEKDVVAATASRKRKNTAVVVADPVADADAKAKARVYASHMATQPAANAERILRLYGDAHGTLDPQTTFDRIAARCSDDERALRYAKYTLAAQAQALDVLFMDLALRERDEHCQPLGAYLKLALRAQSQCRATLETLGELIRPPVVLAHQANIAQGHQQVNNGDAVPVARVESQKPQTELLEAPCGKPQWMDAGAARAAASSDSTMATVGQGDGAADGRRQGAIEPQRVEGRRA